MGAALCAVRLLQQPIVDAQRFVFGSLSVTACWKMKDVRICCSAGICVRIHIHEQLVFGVGLQLLLGNDSPQVVAAEAVGGIFFVAARRQRTEPDFGDGDPVDRVRAGSRAARKTAKNSQLSWESFFAAPKAVSTWLVSTCKSCAARTAGSRSSSSAWRARGLLTNPAQQ